MNENAREAARLFMREVASRFDVVGAFAFGSRVRDEHRPDSDLDIAVLLRGSGQDRVDAALIMADVAFDVLMKTGVLVGAIPIWEDEWEQPVRFSNPDLLENIRKEGVAL